MPVSSICIKFNLQFISGLVVWNIYCVPSQRYYSEQNDSVSVEVMGTNILSSLFGSQQITLDMDLCMMPSMNICKLSCFCFDYFPIDPFMSKQIDYK